MMNKLHLSGLWSLVILVFALSSGCASLSPYSISEGELESHLQDAVRDYDRVQLKSGSPLSLSLDGADVTLGPDGRDVAVIDLKGQVAIYIRRIKLLESSVDAGFFKGDLAPITDNVMRVVAQMLETMPVYRLDEANTAQRLFGMVPMDIRVAPGRLEFVMAD